MKSGNLTISLIAVTIAVLIYSCSDRSPVNTGDTVQNHPVISGVLYNGDGSVCSNAQVFICTRASLADTGSSVLSKSAVNSFTTTSDNAGRYSFDATLAPDIYVVDARNSGNAVRIDSIDIKKTNEYVNVKAGTLKPVGAIKGQIQRGDDDPSHICYILAFGTCTFTQTNADGSFVLRNLAEGTYALRILPNFASCGILDTGTIKVTSGDTTDLGSVSLPGSDALIPKASKLVFDTMKQVVTLSWNSISDVRAKRFNVYRKNVSTNGASIKIFSSVDRTDTLMIDSVCHQDQTYEYHVTSLTTDNKESQKGSSCLVTIASYVTADTVFKNIFQPEGVNDFILEFAVSPQNDIYIPRVFSKNITVFDSTMKVKQLLQNEKFNYTENCFYDKRLYQLHIDPDMRTKYVLAFSENGAFIDTVITELKTLRFNAGYGLLATVSAPDTTGTGTVVNIYSVDGTLKKTWRIEQTYTCRAVKLISETELICLFETAGSAAKSIITYDTDGNKKAEKLFNTNKRINDFEYDPGKKLLYIAIADMRLISNDYETGTALVSGRIEVYNQSFSLVALYNVFHGGELSDIAINDNGNFYIGVGKVSGPKPAGASIIKLNPVNR